MAKSVVSSSIAISSSSSNSNEKLSLESSDVSLIASRTESSSNCEISIDSPLINLSYLRMVLMALPYTIVLSIVGFASIVYLL